MKRLVLFICVLVSPLLHGQDFSASWQGFFSYTTIVDLEEGNGRVYGATGNAVFIYNTQTRTFQTLTTINGLSGDAISQIHYDEDRNILVIGYENGLLQLVPSDGEVRTIVAIRDKQVIRPDRKRINEFKQNGNLLYIAAEFGIAIYNLDRLEFDDTYFIGDNGEQLRVRSLEIYRGFLYAATRDGGMRRANIADPFLIDFSNWNRINTNLWNEVIQFGTELIATTLGRTVHMFNGAAFSGAFLTFPQTIRDVDVEGGRFAIVGTNQIIIYDQNFDPQITISDIDGEPQTYTTGIIVGDDLYAGTDGNGILRINLNSSTDFEFIVEDGPIRNDIFSVTSVAEQLWVGYGDYAVFFNPFPLESFGISKLVPEQPWQNFTFEEVLEARSLSGIVVNPSNPNQAFLNSMIDAQVLFEDDMAVQLINSTNSSFVPQGTSGIDARLPSGVFDQAGNMWTLQSFTDMGLHRRDPSGNTTAIDLSVAFPDVFENTGMTKITTDRQGNVYFGTIDNGLFAYNPTLDIFGNIQEGVTLGNLVNTYVTAVTIDQNNQIWIGSNLGLRVFSNATSMFDDAPGDARPIIIEDVSGIPRELLADEAVVDIEVDGNNRKWVATTASGVFLFSPNGQETIFQFTKDNSPLPSNTVNDITIEESTGRVFIATENGLVAFLGQRSSQPQENLERVFAFPNPVRPGYDGDVTIDLLTDRARIKIVDIEGNIVNELVSNGGTVTWDTRNFSGTKVASGVYLLLINTDDAIETTVFKLMIIR